MADDLMRRTIDIKRELQARTGGKWSEDWTVRDEFAAAALQGMVIGINLDPDRAGAIKSMASARLLSSSEMMARICFDYADAMLAAREAKP